MTLLNNRYYLVRQVGKGGMGVVYKAKDSLLGDRFVAIKEMNQGNLSGIELLRATRAFKQEALLLANLSHQNLPRIHDHFDDNGRSYLVMDYIEGETLAELLLQSPNQALLVEEVLLIAEQLSSVLGYLHAYHPPIIFRDIKPGNIMITSHGDHLYLIDFGIARFFKPGQLKDTLTFGTVGYAPPEQYHSQTSEASDIYSMGVTLHQLLTGLDPTRTSTPFSFPSIRAYNPHISPLLEALVIQMVEANPANRPASMLQVKRALHNIRQWSQQAVGSFVQVTNSIPAVSNPASIRPPALSAEGKTLGIYRYHSDTVYSVAWSPDGGHIVSGSRDKTVHVWNASMSNKGFVYKAHTSYVYGVAWSPDGKRIASTSFGNVHIWNTSKTEHALVYHEHSLWVYTVAWAPGGLMIASGGADGEVHLWDTRMGEVISKYQGYPKAIRTIAWSGNVSSARLLVGCEDATLYCWEMGQESIPIMYQGHSKEITSVAWSPDATRVASGSRDKTVKIWDAFSNKLLYTYKGHTKDVHCITWSPDGRYIASAGEDKTVRIWDAYSGVTLTLYHGHAKEIYTVAWSPDGKKIASAGEDKTVRVWQIV
jgi:serine/threonine protein kinase